MHALCLCLFLFLQVSNGELCRARYVCVRICVCQTKKRGESRETWEAFAVCVMRARAGCDGLGWAVTARTLCITWLTGASDAVGDDGSHGPGSREEEGMYAW